MLKKMIKERRALHEHMNRLSCNTSNVPVTYFDQCVPERFCEMYRLSIIDSLRWLVCCLVGLYLLTSINKLIIQVFRR